MVALFVALRCLGLGLAHCMSGVDMGVENRLRGIHMDFPLGVHRVHLDFQRRLRSVGEG